MFGNKGTGQMFGNIRKGNMFGNKWAGHMFGNKGTGYMFCNMDREHDLTLIDIIYLRFWIKGGEYGKVHLFTNQINLCVYNLRTSPPPGSPCLLLNQNIQSENRNIKGNTTFVNNLLVLNDKRIKMLFIQQKDETRCHNVSRLYLHRN